MKVSTNGVEINYSIEGEGQEWITLSHSLACNMSMWDEQMDLLKPNFKVLRFDTRGHGGSSAPAGPYTLEQLADDVHGLFAALGIKQTHWVGLSMGGMIGETFALKYPGMFTSLVLADTTSRRPPNAEQMWGDRIKAVEANGMQAVLQTTLERWFTAPYREKHPEVMARISADILGTPVAGFAGCCAAISTIDVMDRLKEIKCPTLVTVGEHDHGTPPEMAKLIHENLPGSELFIIPDAAHIASIEQKDVFNKMLSGFLARVAGK
jgi:3-oxoadipate enol-lactonase